MYRYLLTSLIAVKYCKMSQAFLKLQNSHGWFDLYYARRDCSIQAVVVFDHENWAIYHLFDAI